MVIQFCQTYDEDTLHPRSHCSRYTNVQFNNKILQLHLISFCSILSACVAKTDNEEKDEVSKRPDTEHRKRMNLSILINKVINETAELMTLVTISYCPKLVEKYQHIEYRQKSNIVHP